MKDPFLIDGPTSISFSGGRTSAYMLWRVLEQHGGTLPNDVFVCFANTGKEREETLEFVRECGERWRVPIVWLEVAKHETPAKRFKVVDFETASRNGEPFDLVISNHNKMVPTPLIRYCTIEMKIQPITRYLKSIGITEWTSFLGIRKDEERRAAKINGSASPTKGEERFLPLHRADVTREEVLAFWESQPFDLHLPVFNGETIHGNCDLCFLKGKDKKIQIIKDRPEVADWWIKKEKEMGGSFSKNYTVEDLKRMALEQIPIAFEDSIECFCGD